MTFDEWWNTHWYSYSPASTEAGKAIWDAAITAALEKLDEHWYSKDKAQKAVQDLLTAS